ncbi:autotransporter domain-containing protein [Aquabacter spiritensis]|uniref:Outer membrane autotransporter protein n=1 Tax=Aquabacter spiritensis TaxID=933073 RepID=A0A4R3M3G6_9HYPH|nr:autotransporter domain-containing protein [Aquabacter spiritensis]TCT06769.1 outer membrane autotransporter protein [Aquabacter spiritensis]
MIHFQRSARGSVCASQPTFSRTALLASVAVVSTLLAGTSARATGLEPYETIGGSGSGGGGGVTSIEPAGTGGVGNSGSGAGGGGAGVTGGAGGTAGTTPGGVGGVSTGLASPYGQAGSTDQSTQNGSGGGGGAHGYVGSTIPGSFTFGGGGGAGGDGAGTYGGGGGGGAGGYGAIITGVSTETVTLDHSSGIWGLSGGDGGAGYIAGQGGQGGLGLLLDLTTDVKTLNIATSINGGSGGNGGASNGGSDATGGAGGAGSIGLYLSMSGAGTLTTTISRALNGGRGGDGGFVDDGTGAVGGTGGDGGVALYVVPTDAWVITIGALIRGQDAGAGGASRDSTGGSGGAGGVAIYVDPSQTSKVTTINVGSDGLVFGGTGGAGGDGTPSGSFGAGGAGIQGANLSIVLSSGAVVAGGWDGDGYNTRAPAIKFTGGNNTLELGDAAGEQGPVILLGNVVGADAGDTLRLGGSGTTSFALGDLNAGGLLAGFGTLESSGSGTWTLAGATTGAPSLKVSSGTLALAADASFGGTPILTVEAGTFDMSALTTSLSVRNLSGADAAGTIELGANALTVSLSVSKTYAGVISGTGTFNKSGVQTLTLTGTSDLTGAVIIQMGGILLGGTGSIAEASLTLGGPLTGFATSATSAATVKNLSGSYTDSFITLSSDLTVNQTAITIFAGQLVGAFDLSVTGTEKLVLTGASTSFGGDLSIGDGATLALSGTGALANAASTEVLGTLDVSAATLDVTLKTLEGTSATASIVGGTTNIEVSQSADGVYAGALSGSGTFTKSGTGVLTLTGDGGAYSGAMTVNAGTLAMGMSEAASGSFGGNVSVANGATLAGKGGSIGGEVIVNAGGILSAVAGEGGLTAQTFSLASGAVINVSLAAPDDNGLFFARGSGGTVNGTLNITDLPGYGVGVYRVFSSPGDLTDNGLVLGTLVSGDYYNTLDVSSRAVDVVVEQIDNSVQYWSANGTERGGAGTWTSSNPWLNTGGPAGPWAGQTGVFDGTAGAVTVDGAQAFYTLEFLTTGYTVAAGSAGSLNLGTGGRVWAEGADVTATISAPITGTGALTKIGAGTVILTGANTYEGGTILSAGTLQVAADSQLGAQSGGLTFNGGTLHFVDAVTTDRAIEIQAGGGTIQMATDKWITASGVISGEGALTLTGSSVFFPTAINTYSGGTLVTDHAAVVIVDDRNLGAVSGALTLSSGALAATRSVTVERDIVLIGEGNQLVASAGNLTLSGDMSGAGGFVSVTQQGAVVLTGDSRNTGAIGVTLGTLQVGDMGTTGSIVADVAVTGSLDFARTDTLTYGGVISGSGSVTQKGGGTLILTGDSTFTGLTFIASGTVQLGNGGTSGAIASPMVMNGGTLAFNRSDDVTFDSIITGVGSVVQKGPGTLTLTAENTYAGGTSITGGTLRIASDGVLGAASGGLTFDGGTLSFATYMTMTRDVTLLSDGGTLSWDQSDTLMMSGVISGEGALTLTGGGLFSLANANTYTGGTVVTGESVLAVGDDSSLGAVSGTLTLSTGALVVYEAFDPFTIARNMTLVGSENVVSVDTTTLTLAGTVSGAGGFTKIGSGTVVLTGTNSYAGGTTIAGGTVQVSSDANLGAASGGLTLSGGTLSTTASFTSARSVVLTQALSSKLAAAPKGSGGTFQVAGETALTLSGVISGSGALTKAGAGTLILTGENTYTGGTTISAGTLQLGIGGASGSIVGDVVNNSALVFNRSDTYTFPGTISGSGTVSFTGGGTVLFATPGAYSGPISVSDATVTLETGSTSGSVFTLGTGGVLNGNGTVGGIVANSGGVVAPGNSPGTIAVAGTIAFNSGSVYQVDVTPTGAHDLITATGSVTISNGASVQVLAETGRYTQSTYAILTSSGTVSGTFGAVTSNYAFLTPSLSYDAQNVFLTLVYNNVDFATYAQSPNQFTTAVGTQALGFGNPIYDAMLDLSAASVPGALNALSGEAYASVDTVIQQQSVYVREAVGSRLRQSVSAPAAQPLAYAANGPQTATLGAGLTPTLWAQGYGGWGNSFSDGNAATVSNSIGGFLIGADVAFGSNVRAGLFGGFSQSQFDVTDRASSGSMDNYDVGLYAGAQFGAVALRGGLAYTWHDVSAERSVAFPGYAAMQSAGYTTGTTQLFGEVGYDMTVGAYAFEPFVGLAYLNIGSSAFLESGGGAALAVNTASMDTLYTTLGLRAATSVQFYGRTLTPSLMLGWQHAFGDTTPSSTMRFASGAVPFTVAGAPIAEDALAFEAGLSYALSNVAVLGVNYTGQIATNAAQSAFTAQFSLKF